MKHSAKILVLLIFILSCSHANSIVEGETDDLPDYSQSYDPGRDPFNDLVLATNRAEISKRLVLLIVGGYWCSWCHALDRFLEKNKEYADLFYQTFEVVKVYYGSENENKYFLSKFPRIKGYPHFFIMDENFGILGSQNTGSLELRNKYLLAKESYREQYMNEFLEKWVNYSQKSIDQSFQLIDESGG